MPNPLALLKALSAAKKAEESAALALALKNAKPQRMLQGVYRGYSGEAGGSPVVHYHGGSYVPDTLTERPLYMSRDKAMAQTYADMKGGKVVALAPTPRSTATPRELRELAARYVPENEANFYTPATALDVDMHGQRSVGDLINELWNREHDSARAFDVGMDAGQGGSEGEVLIALPGENIRPAPTAPVFVSPQKRIADYYAQKRAAQTGEAPHAEMLLVDPFAGKAYGHSTMGKGSQEPMTTRARKLRPEDVKERTQLYAKGGAVDTPDPREHKPFNRAANPITQLLRGWAAGTAGLPGDLEGLARMAARYAGANVDEAPALPTSEFYKEWLPGRDTAVGGPEMEGLGAFFGGAGSTALVRPVAPALKALGRAAETSARAGARNLAVPRQLSPQAGVIKLPGGQWLSGSVEGGLGGLRGRVRTEGINQHTAEHAATDTALNNWIDKQLTRYVKNDMATPGDPVRALAERGVLHVNPEQLNFRPEMHGKYMEPGQTAVAQNPMAKVWEGASDLKVHTTSPRQILGNDAWIPAELDTRIGANPWLLKVPPETPVHGLAEPRTLPQDLGFSHLIDELRNATNPESGLPAELLLKYSSLPQVSVPQAVERVAKINEWRAAQKVAADQARAQNPATQVFKEYAENNPKGFKWVELKKNEQLPEGWSEEGGRLRDPSTGGLTDTDPRQAALAEALKYEGDVMGHCVGGYCPDVIEGKSRIFSLRSGKGEPHVTIEVQPTGRDPYAVAFENLPKAEQRKLHMEALGDDSGLGKFVNPDEADANAAKVRALMAERYPELAQIQPEFSIKQIKGKANRAPNEEYLPYVQDFVKSGQWSDVGDASNAGLRKFTDVFNNNELRALQEAGAELPTRGWLTGEEIQNLHNLITPEGKRLTYGPKGNITGGFAAGGIVESQNSGYNADRVEEILTQLRAELA